MMLRAGEPGMRKGYYPYCRTDPWEGHGTPIRGRHLPREAHLSSRPQTSEHCYSDTGTEFSRMEARPSPHPGLHILMHTEHGQGSIFSLQKASSLV